MNKSELLAILALVGWVFGAVSNYVATKTFPDWTVAVPLLTAIWSAFHASTAAAPAAAPAADAPKA